MTPLDSQIAAVARQQKRKLVDGEAAVLSRQAAEVLGVREGDLVKVKA